MWYGKGPGVDRCGDVFKHANAAGTSKHGGVLAPATTTRRSPRRCRNEHIFKACLIPVLNPSNVQDYLDLGLHGFAMSRYRRWPSSASPTSSNRGSVIVDPDRVKTDAARLRAPPTG